MIRRGVSRRVLLVGPWAIKIPSAHYGLTYAIQGWLGNRLEAERWRTAHGTPAAAHLAPVYAAPLWGLLLVMRREQPIARRLTAEEARALPIMNLDNNGDNVAMRDGRLVVIDYGNADAYLVIGDFS